MRFGIIGAMEEEIAALKKVIKFKNEKTIGKLIFYEADYSENIELAVVKAGIGKVNAAMCTQMLIDYYKPDYIVNIGVAGAIAPEVNLGDVIVSTNLIQHDFDCTAFGYKKGRIPQMEDSDFKADENLIEKSRNAGKKLGFNLFAGTIVSGDLFVNSNELKNSLYKEFNAKCCEMEGAAIAHVAQENNVPFVVYRAISDGANNDANMNYEDFMLKACEISKDLILEVLDSYKF